MLKKLVYIIFVLLFAGVPAKCEDVKIAVVPGGDPKPVELLTLTEAKLFAEKEIALVERTEIDKVLAEQKLSGMFDAAHAVQLGQILKADLFAVLETTSIVIFDAHTGLRFVDETFSEKIETDAKTATEAVKTAIEKRQKLAEGKLVTFGVLEVRNADFPVSRDAWCRAVAGMLERSLLHRGGAVLERSRLQFVNKERALTGDTENSLLASMKLIDLEFTRGETPETFKITARIGNETFRTDGSLDKPLDVVHKIAEQLLKDNSQESTQQEAAQMRKAESMRFRREASFLHAWKRYDDALELAEVAFALDPAIGKKTLCDCLYSIAYQKARPPVASGRSFVQPTVEEIQEIVQLVTRIIDLLETPPFINGFHSLCFIRERSVLFEGWQPECREILQAFHHRAVNYWYRTSFDTNAIKTNDPVKNFATAVSRLPARAYNASAGSTVFVRSMSSLDPQPAFAAYNAAVFEMAFGSIIQLFHQIPEENRNKISTNTLYSFRKLLEQFADEATALRNATSDKRDENAWRAYQHTIDLMEESPSAEIRNYAWIAVNKPAFTPGREQADDYFKRLTQRIEEHPPINDKNEIQVLYDEITNFTISRRRELIPYCVAQRPAQMTSEEDHLALPYYAEILKTAVERKEEEIIPKISTALFALVRKNRNLESDEITLDTKARYEETLADCLAFLETDSPEMYTTLKSLVDNDLNSRTAARPPVPRAKPWSEEIPIVSYESDRPVIFCPLVRGKTLYFFTSLPNDSIRLNSLNLETFQITEGRTYPHQGGIQYFMPYGDTIYDILTRLPHGHVDHQSVYLVGRGNIHIFPLNGDDQWTFGVENGLPAAPTRQVCSYNGKLYTTLGTTVVRFVEIDLETKTFEILSSTSAKEGKTPFVNLGTAPEFNCFFTDEVRDRLIFFVYGIFGGVWSMDNTGTFTHHLRREWLEPNRVQVLDENRIFVSGLRTAEIFDLNDLTEEREPTLIAGNLHRIPRDATRPSPLTKLRPNPIMGQLVFFQNELWGNIRNPKTVGLINATRVSWDRWSLGEDSKKQVLPVPKDFKNLTMIVPLPNDKGLLVGDGHSIVHLRFETP